MKKTLQSRFIHCIAPHLSSDILLPTDYGTIIKSLHLEPFFICKSLLSPNRVLQTAFPQIASEEAKLPRSYRSTLSQLWSSFCSSLHPSRERIGLVPSSLCPSCGLVSHTTVQVFSCSSHPTSLNELDLWKRCAWRRSSCRTFFSLTSRLFVLLPPNLLLLTDKRDSSKYHHHAFKTSCVVQRPPEKIFKHYNFPYMTY